jgi:hypothetical protein
MKDFHLWQKPLQEEMYSICYTKKLIFQNFSIRFPNDQKWKTKILFKIATTLISMKDFHLWQKPLQEEMYSICYTKKLIFQNFSIFLVF